MGFFKKKVVFIKGSKSQDLTEALVRGEQQDKVYIGSVAERLYNSETGELLRAIINGHIQEDAKLNANGMQIPSDMVLGRIQAYQTIIDDLERMIFDKFVLVNHHEGDEQKEEEFDPRIED